MSLVGHLRVRLPDKALRQLSDSLLFANGPLIKLVHGLSSINILLVVLKYVHEPVLILGCCVILVLLIFLANEFLKILVLPQLREVL